MSLTQQDISPKRQQQNFVATSLEIPSLSWYAIIIVYHEKRRKAAMTKAHTENTTINTILTETVDFYRQKYGNQLAQVWLYGSKARGDYAEDSDTDIMVIVDEDAPINRELDIDSERYDMAMSILARYDELISVMTYTTADFNSDAISLHRNVKKEGILYYDKHR